MRGNGGDEERVNASAEWLAALTKRTVIALLRRESAGPGERKKEVLLGCLSRLGSLFRASVEARAANTEEGEWASRLLDRGITETSVRVEWLNQDDGKRAEDFRRCGLREHIETITGLGKKRRWELSEKEREEYRIAYTRLRDNGVGPEAIGEQGARNWLPKAGSVQSMFRDVGRARDYVFGFCMSAEMEHGSWPHSQDYHLREVGKRRWAADTQWYGQDARTVLPGILAVTTAFRAVASQSSEGRRTEQLMGRIQKKARQLRDNWDAVQINRREEVGKETETLERGELEKRFSKIAIEWETRWGHSGQLGAADNRDVSDFHRWTLEWLDRLFRWTPEQVSGWGYEEEHAAVLGLLVHSCQAARGVTHFYQQGERAAAQIAERVVIETAATGIWLAKNGSEYVRDYIKCGYQGRARALKELKALDKAELGRTTRRLKESIKRKLREDVGNVDELEVQERRQWRVKGKTISEVVREGLGEQLAEIWRRLSESTHGRWSDVQMHELDYTHMGTATARTTGCQAAPHEATMAIVVLAEASAFWLRAIGHDEPGAIAEKLRTLQRALFEQVLRSYYEK